MTHLFGGVSACWLAVSFLGSLAHGQAKLAAIREVTIESSWGGLGKPSQTKVLVRNTARGFYRSGQAVDNQWLNLLLTSFRAPVVDRPRMENLGITAEWLQKNLEIVAPLHGRHSYHYGAQNQKALYRSSFTDTATVSKALLRIFGFAATDDYPQVHVSIAFVDGGVWTASSDSQYQFVLPWTIRIDGKEQETFNADISRAVASLLPRNATNQERIAGTNLAQELADAVMAEIERQWSSLDVENRAGSALAALRGQFSVTDTEINPYHNVDHGKEWRRGNSQETNLHASLRRETFPPSFSANLVLLFQDSRVYGVEEFLQQSIRYETLALSVPWLRTYMVQHPKVPVSLLYVHDCSLSERAMSIFADDMVALGKKDLAQTVERVRKELVLLNIGYGARWLLLPDHRMILWRYTRQAGLLNWAPSDFSMRDCTDYRELGGGCVGAVVSPDGTLMR